MEQEQLDLEDNTIFTTPKGVVVANYMRLLHIFSLLEAVLIGRREGHC